uniref:Uncharacterized protein n=1 Tax=Neobodo designis TaxID=312471 RepID=A0A6U4QIH2_NEODS|mmetsp:Transcript_20139/g.62564  ORF Transcript_20139/g.62564 Transcript_20139/m.62564 type:complete len:189 (+) Transcript_20139:162-728(+)
MASRARRSRDDEAADPLRSDERTRGAHDAGTERRRGGAMAEPPMAPPAPAPPAGMTNAPANAGVSGTRFMSAPSQASPEASAGAGSARSFATAPISRPSPGLAGSGSRSGSVSVFGLQTASSSGRPSAFAPVRSHATGATHWPHARSELAPTPTRPATSSLNDWDSKPPVQGDAARDLALRLGAMKLS